MLKVYTACLNFTQCMLSVGKMFIIPEMLSLFVDFVG